MDILIIVLCSVMIIMAIFLVVAVLMQSGKDSRLSGTIAGGAETFFGKTKGKSIDRILSKVTTVVSIIFVVLVLLIYVLQGISGKNDVSQKDDGKTDSKVEDVVETEEEVDETVTEEKEIETAEENKTAETETAIQEEAAN